jgi:uncharacterized membrane protein
MQMVVYIVAYLAAAVVFCLMDFVWLTIIAKDFYQSRMGSLMLYEIKFSAAITFYLLYLMGLLIFAIMPALRAQHWLVALGLSAFLGLIAYASYDLTNLATLKGWSLSLSLVDIIWGVVVSSCAGTAGFFAARTIEKIY